MQYEILVKEVNHKMPERYRKNPVKDCIFDFRPPVGIMNFNPYKNKGKILPDEYRFIDCKTGQRMIPYSKGEYYIPEMLYWINYHKEYDMLAPTIIFSCMTDFRDDIFRKNLISKNDFIDIYRKAKDTIQENKYPIPNPRCKRVLPYRDTSSDKIDKYITEGKPFKDEKTLATAFTEIFETSIKPYTLEYWHFSDNEQEYAQGTYRNAAISFQEELINKINQRQGNADNYE